MKQRRPLKRRTPMPRGTTPLRRTELRRSSQPPVPGSGLPSSGSSLQRRTPMPRRSVSDASSGGPTPPTRNGPVKARKPAQSAEEKRGREVVYPRAGGWCEIQLAGVCTGRASEWHHRQNRSQGGRWSASNGLHLDSRCHRWVTENPEAARASGWSVPSTEDPAEVPVLRRGVWVLLDDEGGIAAVEGSAA